MSDIKLGVQQTYESVYNPALLQPLPREKKYRANQPCYGVDLWTAYELSWLDPQGKPVVAVGEFLVPALSEFLVESKSLKYYLNSFNQTQIADRDAFKRLLESDLSRAVGAAVEVRLYSLAEFARLRRGGETLGIELDGNDLRDPVYAPIAPTFTRCQDKRAQSVWVSHLLKSNCPVTGQPDWASVWFGIDGVVIEPQQLLHYVVSFREHPGFHEHCVERMFAELFAALAPERLWVYARYTRRGGLDINPFRASEPMTPPQLWGARQ